MHLPSLDSMYRSTCAYAREVRNSFKPTQVADRGEFAAQSFLAGFVNVYPVIGPCADTFIAAMGPGDNVSPTVTRRAGGTAALSALAMGLAAGVSAWFGADFMTGLCAMGAAGTVASVPLYYATVRDLCAHK